MSATYNGLGYYKSIKTDTDTLWVLCGEGVDAWEYPDVPWGEEQWHGSLWDDEYVFKCVHEQGWAIGETLAYSNYYPSCGYWYADYGTSPESLNGDGRKHRPTIPIVDNGTGNYYPALPWRTQGTARFQSILNFTPLERVCTEFTFGYWNSTCNGKHGGLFDTTQPGLQGTINTISPVTGESNINRGCTINCTSWDNSSTFDTAGMTTVDKYNYFISNSPVGSVVTARNIKDSFFIAARVDVPKMDIFGCKIQRSGSYGTILETLVGTNVVWDGVNKDATYRSEKIYTQKEHTMKNTCLVLSEYGWIANKHNVHGCDISHGNFDNGYGHFTVNNLNLSNCKFNLQAFGNISGDNGTPGYGVSDRFDNFTCTNWVGDFKFTFTQYYDDSGKTSWYFMNDNEVTRTADITFFPQYDSSTREILFKNCTFADVNLVVAIKSTGVAHGVFTDTPDGHGNFIVLPLGYVFEDVIFDYTLPPEEQDPRLTWGGVGDVLIDLGPGDGTKDLARYGITPNTLNPTDIINLKEGANPHRTDGRPLAGDIERKEDFSKLFSGPSGISTVQNNALYMAYIDFAPTTGDGPPCLEE